MSTAGDTPPKKQASPVKVSIKIVGTESSGFRFRNGVLSSSRLTDSIELDHDRARRLAEFYIQLLSETPKAEEPPTLKEAADNLFVNISGVP